MLALLLVWLQPATRKQEIRHSELTKNTSLPLSILIAPGFY
jgi:hypothetical protein